MSRKEKELLFTASCINFRHLCCLLIESSKSWRSSLDEKITKILSTYLLYIIDLKWIGQLSNHFFYDGIEMHLQEWGPKFINLLYNLFIN